MTGSQADAATVAKAPGGFWNVPNTLTVSRLVLAVFVFALIANEFYRSALVIFVIAALTDALDGYFARLLKQDTPLGRQLDPLDRQGHRRGLLHLPGSHPRYRCPPVDGHRDHRPRAADSGPPQPPRRAAANRSGPRWRASSRRFASASRSAWSCSVSILLPSKPPVFWWLRDGLTWLAVILTIYSGLSYVWIALPSFRGER